MDQSRTVSRETVIDLAAFLVRDMDRIADYAHGVENLPKMHAKYLGQIEGERTALSYIAGMLFYPTTDALIAQVRRERASIVPAADARAVADVLAADARANWPVDHAEGE